MRRAIPLLLLGLLATGCGKEEMEDFVSNLMHPEFNVDYADEGKVFVLVNNCLEHGAGTDAYKSCTVKWGPAGPIVSDDVGVEVIPFGPDEVSKAVPYAREYQWVTVNPSFSSVGGALVHLVLQFGRFQRLAHGLHIQPQAPLVVALLLARVGAQRVPAERDPSRR